MAKQTKTTKNTKAKKATSQPKLKLQKEKDYSQSIIIAILSALLVLVSVNIIISAVSASNFITSQDAQLDNLRRENARLKAEIGEDSTTEEHVETDQTETEQTETDQTEAEQVEEDTVEQAE